MKIITVKDSDYGDYGAMEFEHSSYCTEEKLRELYTLAEQGPYLLDMPDKGCQLKIEAFEFEEVDPEFIQFMIDEFLDYDALKSHNFYVVEE